MQPTGGYARPTHLVRQPVPRIVVPWVVLTDGTQHGDEFFAVAGAVAEKEPCLVEARVRQLGGRASKTLQQLQVPLNAPLRLLPHTKAVKRVRQQRLGLWHEVKLRHQAMQLLLGGIGVHLEVLHDIDEYALQTLPLFRTHSLQACIP